MAVDLLRRSLQLIADPAFIRFANGTSEPNFFKIVGGTHFERWHSCFWGWLFDPSGSHALGDYAVNRLLLSLLDDRCVKPVEVRHTERQDVDACSPIVQDAGHAVVQVRTERRLLHQVDQVSGDNHSRAPTDGV